MVLIVLVYNTLTTWLP